MTDNIDDQYDEAMELFGGKIPKIGEPTEYTEAMIKKYGHIPELNRMVAVDEDDYAIPTKYIPAPEDDSGW